MRQLVAVVLSMTLLACVPATAGLGPGPDDDTYVGNILIGNFGSDAVYVAVDRLGTKGPDGTVDLILGVVGDAPMPAINARLQQARIVVQDTRFFVIAADATYVFDHGQPCDDCAFAPNVAVTRLSGYGLLRRSTGPNAPQLDKLRPHDGVTIAAGSDEEWVPWEPWDGGGGGGSPTCSSGGSGATACSIGECGNSCSVSCGTGYACCKCTFCSCSCKCVK